MSEDKGRVAITKRFKVRINETKHFEFEVWAEDRSAARDLACRTWRDAHTVGQWEVPDTETDYELIELTSAARQTREETKGP